MNQEKVKTYLFLIKKSHETFREFLSHLNEEMLHWKINEQCNSIQWIINHTLKDQKWILDLIFGESYKPISFKEISEHNTINEILGIYDSFVEKIPSRFERLSDEDLDKNILFKGYTLRLEDWLYEYIHHLSYHSGEMGLYSVLWKRKQRSLTS
ncbi:MAG: DinB family protein [Candidatus Heimdallarchaeaceae archaeon]